MGIHIEATNNNENNEKYIKIVIPTAEQRTRFYERQQSYAKASGDQYVKKVNTLKQGINNGKK